MAIDFLIFALLLISFVINLLALGAFWVTPGLRTTANRFTINLLIVNLVGCLILAPTLFLRTSFTADGSEADLIQTSDDSIEILTKAGNHQMTVRHKGKLVEQEGIILQHNVTANTDADNGAQTPDNDARTIETIFKRNSTYYQELTIDESNDAIVITEIEEDAPAVASIEKPQQLEEELHIPYGSMRCWSIDMAAALGALAVLLVVGDTWCAVTDPLRYHSRISGLKTWMFIAVAWFMGILFGALSALREIDFESETILSRQQNLLTTYTHTALNTSTANSVFGMIYACLYFVVVILLPFGFVCGMYWRIFSEARENGLRMRQNGSSPLLQSALNLTHHQHGSALQYSNSLCVHRQSISSASSLGGGGLQMQIDQQHQRKNSPAFTRRDSAAKVLLPTISDDGTSDDGNVEVTTTVGGQLVPVPEQPNQNILLTLQTASGEIKRNYSARQLPLLGTSSQDLREANRLQGIRQVHSSPNLHKFTQLRQDSFEEEGSPHLLGHPQRPHLHPAQRFHAHQLSQPVPVHFQNAYQHSHVLQVPAIHASASPKALSYMSSLRHRLSNASSLFKYREESRAARISILVVIMFLVSYLPYGMLVLLQSRVSAANFPHSTQLAIFMVLLGNLSSPFIFAYRNKRVRRGVTRLFGKEKRCRERALQRQASSLKTSNANIKRNGSKVSTYSSNSCKYLTPQNSVVSNGGMPSAVHTLALRPNNSCSTIINFSLSKQDSSVDKDAVPATPTEVCMQSALKSPHTRSPRPVLQRGITIVEQIPISGSGKFSAKHNFFKMFFQSSKNLSCAAAQSCAHGGKEVEPTEV